VGSTVQGRIFFNNFKIKHSDDVPIKVTQKVTGTIRYSIVGGLCF